jgi:hypothetical protein
LKGTKQQPNTIRRRLTYGVCHLTLEANGTTYSKLGPLLFLLLLLSLSLLLLLLTCLHSTFGGWSTAHDILL